MRTSEIDMVKSVELADIDTFIDNATWAIHSTYHAVLKASPNAAIFGRDMLFNIPFIADWFKTRVNYDYKVGDKILIDKDGILHKAASRWNKEPWAIMTVHTNGTIRIQCGTK